MSTNTSTTTDLLIDIEEYNTETLITYLQNQQILNLSKQHINVLRENEVAGYDFLRLKQEDLERYGLKSGPAKRILDFANQLNSQNLLINEQELFRTVIPDLSFIEIKTKSTVNSASRRVPNSIVLPWKTFLDEAFNASLSIDAVACKFVKLKLDSLSINSEDTAVDLFLETVGYVNGQRLLKLQTPQMWCRQNQVNIIKGEPDIIYIGAPDRTTLRSTNAAGINVLATVEVKLEQLMNQILQEIINEQVVHENIHHDDYCELYFLYNLARVKDRNTVTGYTKYNNLKKIVHQGFGYMVVNDCRYGIITTLEQTWFICREPENPNIFLISPAVPINQIHTSDRASFWECLRYFEDLSMLNPTTYSYPPVTLNDSDDEDPDNKD
ncbi:hypothetical protein RhiirA4_475304 [Rhizophagus irregularis]|uniref:Uncharacterized protein n=1 Tax=Rhizophagus irregularis TaxID=588596 RepID=A0A2I1H9X0_9GLOM|nr:hypothetical protein RhiirA4_475304 [Rhizophagus irregularis]